MEESFWLKEDIRKPVLPFVRLLSVSHRIHFMFTWSFYSLSKSFVTTYHLIVFSRFLDSFPVPKLLVPIKVPHRPATGNSIHCA